MIAYTCKYTPIELFAGFGEMPEQLNPTAENLEEADRLSHRNLCSFSRALLQTCREHDTQKLVLTSCCDSMRRVGDVLHAADPNAFLYILDLPHSDGPCAQKRYAAELRRLIDAYSQKYQVPFDLQKCRAAFLQETDAEKEDYFALLGARSNAGLLQMLQQELPLPVRDRTCVENRRLPAPPAGQNLEEFLLWYAGALLGQLPCMRMTEISQRRVLLEDPHLKGILYHTLKFCDYYGFEYAALQQETRLPLLKLETDGTAGAEGQLRTRVQAFAENFHSEKKQKAPVTFTAGAHYAAGIDSGSTSTNVVILNNDGKICGSAIVPTGARAALGAHTALQQALQQAHLSRSQLEEIVATGYGRAYIGAGGRDVTEITCHAKGAYFLDPSVRTIIDIGGQDSKAIRLNDSGTVESFVMNDKCAAGTGRFLEMMAHALQLSMEEMSECGLHWKEDIVISSMCTVFAESEVVSLVAKNKQTADIVHGLNEAVAAKAATLAARVNPQQRFMMTGGVASNRGVVKALEEKLDAPLVVLPEHQLCGALGAALIAFNL
ncbi:MAG: acyl-CoA dehydratase activase [Oscillospiraceae bacterium]|nr:acyl-CoA dehydratase activase [Oscillospiraceae bacterium]